MEQLRIILIILGLLLVLGIWLVDRIRRQRRLMRPPEDWDAIDSYNEDAVSEEDSFPTAQKDLNPDEWVGKAFTAKRHDVLDDAQLEGLHGMAGSTADLEQEIPVLDDVVVFDEPQQARGTSQQNAVPQETVIVLTLLAPKGKPLRGPLLLKALQDSGLEHGNMDIFHYHAGGSSEPLFSAANVLEPGKFILSEIAQMETPGIALFMRLPNQLAGSDALNLMLQKARQMGAQLNATLCDGQRQPLNDKALAEMEEKAMVFPAVN